MNPVSFDIATKLVALGKGAIGGTTDWNLYISVEPENKPDQCFTIYDYPGRGPFDNVNVAGNLHSEQIQIRARGVGYLETYLKLLDLDDVLNHVARWHVHPESGETVEYQKVQRAGSIIFLTRDVRQRCIYTANYNVIRQRT